MATNTAKMKAELEAKTGQLAPEKGTKLKKSMSIAEMIKVMEPEIKRALPEVITPERFTRMALSALNTTPKLAECSHMSFLSALMNAAQLGLEPNTPLGQAYLIPYKNKSGFDVSSRLDIKDYWIWHTVIQRCRLYRRMKSMKMMNLTMNLV